MPGTSARDWMVPLLVRSSLPPRTVIEPPAPPFTIVPVLAMFTIAPTGWSNSMVFSLEVSPVDWIVPELTTWKSATIPAVGTAPTRMASAAPWMTPALFRKN